MTFLVGKLKLSDDKEKQLTMTHDDRIDKLEVKKELSGTKFD